MAARLGVLGGTFDPVHAGHVAAAANARHQLGLDRVLLVVANVPWQKAAAGRAVSAAEDRFAMVAAAVEGIDGLEASRLEIDRGGPSYMADTLAALAAADPGAELFLVVGTDVAAELPTWVRVEEVQRLATLAVVRRAGAEVVPPEGWRVEVVDLPALDLSSSDLRRRAAEGRPLDGLVPPGAVRVIRERRLYPG